MEHHLMSSTGHRRRTIERSWAGRAPSEILSSPRTMKMPLQQNRTPFHRVHRIKVDEKVGLVMTTSSVGGLVVRDLESDEVLWELPKVSFSLLYGRFL